MSWSRSQVKRMSCFLNECVDVLFDDLTDLQLIKYFAEFEENKLDDGFGYNREKVSEIKSVSIFGLGLFAEVEVSSIFFAE